MGARPYVKEGTLRCRKQWAGAHLYVKEGTLLCRTPWVGAHPHFNEGTLRCRTPWRGVIRTFKKADSFSCTPYVVGVFTATSQFAEFPSADVFFFLFFFSCVPICRSSASLQTFQVWCVSRCRQSPRCTSNFSDY